MKRVILLLFIALCISGCMSDRITVSTKLTGHSKSGDVVTLLKDGVIDIHSKSGIGELELTPVSGKWPATVTLRLHLHGLESLRISNGEFTSTASVGSSSPHKQLCEFYSTSDKNGSSVNEDSRYWIPLTVVTKKESEDLEIPLVNGYFEVIISPIFFNKNPKKIYVQWIDFYR